ncbi:hypothetical protein F5883DRAFT_41547 [Diaporthe sp. PMI_573]|nr:hypothetical protein F5883DRAFT_41547 [Diaporthaceae sp. PMI_573]
MESENFFDSYVMLLSDAQFLSPSTQSSPLHNRINLYPSVSIDPYMNCLLIPPSSPIKLETSHLLDTSSNPHSTSTTTVDYNEARTLKAKVATCTAPKTAANAYRCEYPECNGKSYLRREHLKRHYNEAHSQNPEIWRCQFCETPKIFGRLDNFRSHLRRHVKTSGLSRIRHNVGAAILLEEMKSKMKGKRKRLCPHYTDSDWLQPV